MPFMVKAVGTFTWTVFSVLDLNLISLTVLVIQLHLVLILMMLVFDVIPHVSRRVVEWEIKRQRILDLSCDVHISYLCSCMCGEFRPACWWT